MKETTTNNYAVVQNTPVYRRFVLDNTKRAGEGDDEVGIATLKFFTPWGSGTWLISEAQSVMLADGSVDLEMFGLCDLGMGYPELGYVMLSELADVKGPFGMRIERDIFFDCCPLSQQFLNSYKKAQA